MAGRQNLAETVEGLVNFYLMAYISDCRLTWPNSNTLEVTSINWQTRKSICRDSDTGHNFFHGTIILDDLSIKSASSA
jgi:hypothetical protein